MTGILLKVFNVFRSENLAYSRKLAFTASEKVQKTETPKQKGTQDRKQQKTQGSNRSKDREIDLINKKFLRKRKEKVSSARI